jgi:hypothetical protein
VRDILVKSVGSVGVTHERGSCIVLETDDETFAVHLTRASFGALLSSAIERVGFLSIPCTAAAVRAYPDGSGRLSLQFGVGAHSTISIEAEPENARELQFALELGLGTRLSPFLVNFSNTRH